MTLGPLHHNFRRQGVPAVSWDKVKIVEILKLKDDHIKLGQALKAAGLCESGVDAKYAIEDGLVKVNGNVEYQRGKKLRDGDEVTFQGETIRITL